MKVIHYLLSAAFFIFVVLGFAYLYSEIERLKNPSWSWKNSLSGNWMGTTYGPPVTNAVQPTTPGANGGGLPPVKTL